VQPHEELLQQAGHGVRAGTRREHSQLCTRDASSNPQQQKQRSTEQLQRGEMLCVDLECLLTMMQVASCS
jgi:hypothetical protein